jgi:hypothetical protein
MKRRSRARDFIDRRKVTDKVFFLLILHYLGLVKFIEQAGYAKCHVLDQLSSVVWVLQSQQSAPSLAEKGLKLLIA